MTLTRDSKTPSGSKPWLDPPSASDPASAAQSISVTGVRATLAKFDRTGEDAQEASGVFFISTAVTIPEEVSTAWKLVDGAKTYAVREISPVQPGDTLLVYRLEVEV